MREDKINKNLSARYKNGAVRRKNIDKTKRLTGGTIWDANNVLLDEEVLAIREEKEKEKTIEKEKVVLKGVRDFNRRRDDYLDLIQSKLDAKDYKGKHYKTVVKWKKREKDKAVPTKVSELRERFEQTKDRTNLTIMEYFEDRGFLQADSQFRDVVLRILERNHERIEGEQIEGELIEGEMRIAAA